MCHYQETLKELSNPPLPPRQHQPCLHQFSVSSLSTVCPAIYSGILSHWKFVTWNFLFWSSDLWIENLHVMCHWHDKQLGVTLNLVSFFFFMKTRYVSFQCCLLNHRSVSSSLLVSTKQIRMRYFKSKRTDTKKPRFWELEGHLLWLMVHVSWFQAG